MSAIEVVQKIEEKIELQDDDVGEEKEMKKDTSGEDLETKVKSKDIIRYSLPTLLSLRNSKLSQSKPTCKNPDLSCMTHHKPPPKMLIANMMPKFALNQMNSRGEESISPLSFHSNSSSSSNLSYQKRYQDQRSGGNGDTGGDGYYNSRYNKYKVYDDNSGAGSGNSSRIIYKVTSANANNGSNNIRFLKKAYNNKYESQENSSALISNKNILDNSSRVITSADHRNSKRILETISNADDKDDKKKSGGIEKSISDETNNNKEDSKENLKTDVKRVAEINELLQCDLPSKADYNNIADDITNHLDDMFNNLNMSQLLPEKMSDERESSRFSKWFNVNQCDIKEEKTPDLQNNNEDITSITQSVESEKYFQPIEKVESTSLFHILKGSLDNHKPLNDNPLMHMIQQQQTNSTNSGQVHSVEELEARLRQHKGSGEVLSSNENIDSEHKVLQSFFQQQLMPKLLHQQQPRDHVIQQQHHNQEDVNAFKKLLSQITNDDSKLPQQVSASSTTSSSSNLLQQMMSKPYAQRGNDMMLNIPPQQIHQQKVVSPGGKISGRLLNNVTMASPTNTVVGPHMIPPQQQFGNSIEMMKFAQHSKLPQHTQVSDVVSIKRPEVQALVQELASGEVSTYVLWQRLTTPGLSPFERDTITNALNIFNANNNVKNPGGLMFTKQVPSNNIFPQKKAPNALPIPMPQGSPLSPVPPIDQHFLFQQQSSSANKLRLSPLTAPGIPQRIPSPRELQYHTQSIMQNALIRKKLEEQRENFRKRQEQEQKEQTQKQDSGKKHQESVQSTGTLVSSSDDIPKCGPIDSPLKKMQSAQVSGPHQVQQQRQHAPSPNIFTPTSVLRKMTAEKESENVHKICIDKKKPIIGSQSAQSLNRNQQSQQQFVGNISQLDRIMQLHAQPDGFVKSAWDTQSSLKPQGRPIVKSTGPVSLPQQHPQIPNAMANSQVSQSNINYITGNFDFQQQQQHIQKMNMHKQTFNQQHQQLMHLKAQQMDNPVMTPFMTQQQQQQQRTQHIRPKQYLQTNQQQIMQQQMMQGLTKEQEEIEHRNMSNTGGCLSPTSNQLAKWFSPELLADASAGKLPSVKANVLSLEEFERCIQNS